MELSGFSPSEAFDIQDDQSLAPNSDVIEKLLYRIQKTSRKTRNIYSEYSRDVTWEQLLQKTEDYRLWVFNRTATLTKIQKHRFANADTEAAIKGFFVCDCVHTDPVTGDTFPFVAICRSVPKLLFNQSQPENVRVNGFLFNRVSRDQVTKPVFIVDRLGWFPSKESDQATPSQVLLSQHGLDFGEYEFVAPNDKDGLTKKDSEAFYQTIAAVGRITEKRRQEFFTANPPIKFRELMQNGSSNFGNRVRVKGVVRTCSQVHVTDPDIRERLGLSTYYQLILFPNLDGGKIILKNRNGEDLVYSRFPVTVCVANLPDGMTPSDVERKPYEIEGFFFRFWKYKADKTDAAGVSGQVSPLIIANKPTVLESEQELLNSILLVFAAIVLGGIAVTLFLYRSSDKKHKQAKGSILDELPEQIDLTGITE
ncbi:MAG: hypothetical protein AB8B55_16985 [Mariniblastus sp.]